ncbi:outer membrane protein assembly factor BamB family protein [Micromonosporaceae bacterium Da 78-11]
MLALIELDLTAPPDPALSSAPPAQRLRVPGLLLAAVLLLALGGAVPGGSVLWTYLGAIPAPGDPEAPFQLAAGRVYTVATTTTDRVATAWSLETPPRRLWTARFAARVTGPDQVAFGGVEARPAGEVVLMSDGPATVAVDAATGATRWSSPVQVTPLPGNRTGVARYQSFRSGTIYDQEAGEPGPLYFSSTGEPHTEPPLQTEVRAVDLRTGATAWSVLVAGSITVDVAPGPAAGVLITAADRLTLRSGDTGKVVHEVPLPRINGYGPGTGELVGDLMVIDYGDWELADHKVAYSATTLEHRWQRAFPQILMDPANCSDVLCAGGRDAPEVLDPATGRLRWRAPGNTDLLARAGYVVEIDSSSGVPRRLADPVTGFEQVSLRGWRSDVSGSTTGPIVLRRGEAGGASAFGAVLPGRHAVQMLGVTGGAVNDCDADRRFVVCRAAGGLRIWAYRG